MKITVCRTARRIKMAIRFIIDSGSDILPQEAASLGIVHVPLTVRFGTEEYRDAVDLTHREFYERLVESDVLPATSQITPATFDSVFAETTAGGDVAVCITVSSKLSGTYQSACLAAKNYPGKVYVVDSENVCVGIRILVEYGLGLLKECDDVEALVQRLNEEKGRIRVLALLDTLEYLKKGGRISSVTAIAGGILGIKPVAAISDGVVTMVGKARGSKQGNNLLRQLVANDGGINFDRPFALAYSGLSDSLLRKYITDSAELWEGKVDTLPISTVGCVIGTHAGPGAIAVAYFATEA